MTNQTTAPEPVWTEPTMIELVDTVRSRLSDGRTIADHDVHRMVGEIDRLRLLLDEARSGWRNESEKTRHLRSASEFDRATMDSREFCIRELAAQMTRDHHTPSDVEAYLMHGEYGLALDALAKEIMTENSGGASERR